MIAKYNGTCKTCGGKINAGDEINWTKATGASHVTCGNAANPETKHVGNDGRGFPSKYAGTCIECGDNIAVGEMINYKKGAGASHVECPGFQPPVIDGNDDAIIEACWRDGEYYSGYTVRCEDVVMKSIEKLGVTSYLSGWGMKIDTHYVEKLGKQFTLGDAKALVIPILEAKFNKEREQAKRKSTERNDKFTEAKRTGKRVLINQWSEDCNDPREECDIDNVYIYAMPDGTTKKVRSHSW